MPIDMTEMVIAALPGPDGCIDPPRLPAPSGMTYQWANTTLMGRPDLDRLSLLLDNGWAFVAPSVHPTVLAMTMGNAVNGQAFCLLHKSTAHVAEQRARERAPHMDLDTRAIDIMERYTGSAPLVSLGGAAMRVSVAKRHDDGEIARPLDTLDEVRAELLKRFAEADVRLFMRRHFGEQK